MLTDDADPVREPSNLIPINPTDPAPAPELPSLVLKPGTTNGRFALIHALATILVRLDRAASAMQQSPETTTPDEAAHDPE